MNNEINISDLNVETFNYPNWKGGRLWGVIWASPVFIMTLLSPTSELPFLPWYLQMAKNLPTSIVFSGIIFTIVILLVSYKPIKKKKNNQKNQDDAVPSHLI